VAALNASASPASPAQMLTRHATTAISLLSFTPCRSAEGRRRIISEIVKTLAPAAADDQSQQRGPAAAVAPAGAALLAARDSPYLSKPGSPPPFTVGVVWARVRGQPAVAGNAFAGLFPRSSGYRGC
jgi:hypothetical protein